MFGVDSLIHAKRLQSQFPQGSDHSSRWFQEMRKCVRLPEKFSELRFDGTLNMGGYPTSHRPIEMVDFKIETTFFFQENFQKVYMTCLVSKRKSTIFCELPAVLMAPRW